jgi:uncharacterized protein (DUF952 family)
MIFKILPRTLWEAAVAEGALKGSPLDAADGYIHFSTAAQVRETAAKHFAEIADLVLVAVPEDVLGHALKWEKSRGGDLFPHLYAPLRVTFAAWVRPLPIADGQHIFPEF